MAKLITIVKREFLERVRSRWFVIVTLLGPALLAAITLLPAWIASRDRGQSQPGPVVVLDASGAGLGDRVRQALAAPARGLSPMLGQQSASTPAVVRTVAPEALAAAESTATREVMRQTATGYLVLGAGALAGDSVRYAGRNANAIADMARLGAAVRQAVLDTRLEQLGIPRDQATEISRLRAGVKTERLTERGRGGGGDGNILFAFGVSFLLYLAIVLYGQNVLRGVLEEKQTRVAEVVVSSVRPSTLLAGKIIGVGAVGLLQIATWLIGTVAVTAYVAPFLPRGPGAAPSAASIVSLDFSLGMAAVVLVFFVLGYTFYSSLYAAAGAMVNSEQEAQQVLQPLMLPLVGTAVLMQPVMLHPMGTLARVAALFPLSAPVIMPLRMSLVAVPWWEPVLAAVLLLAACGGAVWLSARVYRVGLLMYGKRPTLRELARWARAS